jgi:hypothetical protein
MEVKVDQDDCIGSGNCEATASTVFAVRGGKSHVLVDYGPGGPRGKSAGSCGWLSIGSDLRQLICAYRPYLFFDIVPHSSTFVLVFRQLAVGWVLK